VATFTLCNSDNNMHHLH